MLKRNRQLLLHLRTEDVTGSEPLDLFLVLSDDDLIKIMLDKHAGDINLLEVILINNHLFILFIITILQLEALTLVDAGTVQGVLFSHDLLRQRA